MVGGPGTASVMDPTPIDSVPFFVDNPPPLNDIVTPLRPLEFERELAHHPDRRFVSNFTHGFNIGYTGPRTHLVAPNLTSAKQHPEVVKASLKKKGRLIA